MAINPNLCHLRAGLTGAQLNVEQFDFGNGITLSRTYAHLMAPFLMAFTPAEVGKPHPAPWKPVSGGLSFDIHAELGISEDFNIPNWFDRVNAAWWLISLIRLKATPLIFAPVLASESFASIPLIKHELEFWPFEIHIQRFIPVAEPAKLVNEDDLEWIKKYYISSGKLMNENSDFELAFQAFDTCIWTGETTLSLVSLWGALERLFSPAPYELKFRVSAAIASFLESPGKERLTLFKKVTKLYDARSKAAHGSRFSLEEAQPFIETYALIRRILMKIIESNHVPKRDELEAMMFGETTYV